MNRLEKLLLTGALLVTVPVAADQLFGVKNDGSLRLYNPQGFAQSGEIIISPTGSSEGTNDAIVSYSLDAHETATFPVTPGRVLIRPATSDDVQQPDPIADLEESVNGGIQTAPRFSLEELANKKFLAGYGSNLLLQSGDASQVTIYQMNGSSVVNPQTISLPEKSQALVSLAAPGAFYVDVVAGGVAGAAYKSCGGPQKLTAFEGASPRVHAYVEANLPAAGKRIMLNGWQATEVLKNHFDPLVAVMLQYDGSAVQAFQNSYDVAHAWAALRSDGIADKVSNPEVLTIKLTPKGVLKFLENSYKAVNNSNTAHLNPSSALKPKGLEQSNLGAAGAAAYRAALAGDVLPALVQENLPRFNNLAGSPGWQ